MLGLAPLAAAPLSDDGDRLPRLQASAVGLVTLGGTVGGAARTTGASPLAVLATGGAATGNSTIGARGSDRFSVVAHARTVSLVDAASAKGLAIITSATAGLQTQGSSEGIIAFTAHSDAQSESFGEALSELDLYGVAAAWNATLPSGSGRLEVSGDAQGNAQLQSGISGFITIARQLGADALVESAAAYGIRLSGVTKAAVQTHGVGTDAVILAGRVSASSVAEVAVDRALGLGGDGHVETATTSRTFAVGPALSGFASGTALQARSADAAGSLILGVSASAALASNAITNTVVASGLDAFGNVEAVSVIAGDLSLARQLDADVLATGEANREIGLAGAASAAAVTSADAALARMGFTGTSVGQRAGIGSVRHELAVSGGVELSSSVSAGATTDFAWAGASGAATGSGAGVEAVASLQGQTATTNSIYAIASTSLGLSSHIATAVRPVAQMGGQLRVAGSGSAEVSSLGRVRGVIDVARDFAGDVDILGDSTPAIPIAGRATLQTVDFGTIASAGVSLAGSARTTNASHAQSQALVVSAGTASAQGIATATSHPFLKLSLFADGQSRHIVKSIGTWSAVGQMAATMAMAGSAEIVLPIAIGAKTHTGITATANAAITLTGVSTAKLAAEGSSSDTFGIGRASDTTVAIDADASRSLGVHGYSQGQISIAGDARPLHLGLDTQAGAAAAAAGKASSDMTTAGSAASQAKSLASGQGRLLVDRTGSGDVLVHGAALRGMPLLGASAARTTGLAVANSIVAPNLSVSAANVIHLEFTSEAIAPDGGGVGSNLAAALGISARWDLHTTAIAYRAPPALRRSEPAKYGLSGRLTPSNSGLVLRR